MQSRAYYNDFATPVNIKNWRPQGDLNPCFKDENLAS